MTPAAAPVRVERDLPDWAAWPDGSASGSCTIGIEEELMLVDPADWSLAFRSDEVFADLPAQLRGRVVPETHAAVIETSTGVHTRVADAVAELAGLRHAVAGVLAGHGLCAAVGGMHPSAVWGDTVVSGHRRYRDIAESMRVLARREPTLAMHVHVGVASPEVAIALLNRLRLHVPLLLALAANSPFWQDRPTGFASTRTILFGAFPRTGLPRSFRNYAEWAGVIAALIRAGAIADPSHLWWDVRLQPRYGTVEIRVMDAQTTIADVGALAALVQSLARHETHDAARSLEGWPAAELIEENRFLAARDGMDAHLIDAGRGLRVPATEHLERILTACRPHAEQLGCQQELASLRHLAASNGAARQREHAHGGDLRHVTAALVRAYTSGAEPFHRAA